MDNSNNIKINIRPATEDSLILLTRIIFSEQTEQEKYEALKPVAEKLNYYCDLRGIRLSEDCNFLVVKLKNIHFAYYEEETNMFMLTMENSLDIHVVDLNHKVHTIYMFKEKHNFIASCFEKMYDRIWLKYKCCKIRIQVYIYIFKKLYNNSQKHNSK